MFANLIARFGLLKVISVGLITVLVLGFGMKYGWAEFQVWRLGNKVEKVTAQRDQARAETKVARKDEVQTGRSADITAKTTAAQDQHASAQREATAKTVEVIRERIRQVPVPAATPADDPVVRRAIGEAIARAQAAQDRLQGTPPR